MKLEGLSDFLKTRDAMIAKIDTRMEAVRAELAELEEARQTLVGGAPRAPRTAPLTEDVSKVIAWLAEHAGPRQILEVANGLRIDASVARAALGAAFRAEKIERVSRGVYRAAAVSRPALEETPKRETPADRMARVQNARGGR